MGALLDLVPATDPVDEDMKSGIGPRGKGNPDDTTLRPRELHVNIPAFQEAAAMKVQCKDLLKEFEQCVDNSVMSMYFCKDLRKRVDQCIEYWKNNVEFREQMTAEYLLVRQEYRKTGRNRLYRALKGQTYVTESEREGYHYKL